MASRKERSEDSAPPATTPTRQSHAWDASPQLQMIRDVERAIGRLDERTETLREEVRELRRDVGGMITKGGFWAGIGVVVGVIVAVTLGLAQAYWMALSTKFESIEKMIKQPIAQQAPSVQTDKEKPQ